MSIAPTSLRARRIPLLRRIPRAGEEGWAIPGPGGIVRRIRAIRRIIFVLIWTAIAIPIQALLIALPGSAKVTFARHYWSVMCWGIGLGLRVVGASALDRWTLRSVDGRPVVFVSNHSSWLDVLVLGGRLDACFIAKEDVSRWPVIRTIARLGRSVFVSRARASTGRERDDMRARLAAGDSLVLFPEGTTSDGSRVLPFRSAFLSIAEVPTTLDGRPPLLQPVSVVYDRLGGLPTGRSSRPTFAWYGDMDIASHFWRLAQNRGLRATILLHAPIDPALYPSRKALAHATWVAVANGAATLRQNRHPQPLTVPIPPVADAPVYA